MELYQISSFIYLCFWKRNLRQIKEHAPLEASINIKKSFFGSFTFVYIRLDLSSNSSTFVYTRLNSSTLV